MTTIKLKNGSGAPTAGDLAQGEPALDLTNKRLYTEDSGGTVIEVGTNPGTDVTFADNRKAVFGAGSDLQIYHDGTKSLVRDVGTGDLVAQGNNLSLQDVFSENYLTAVSNGAVTLYHDGLAKLATTSTGIDVTGTVTADGLTVDGAWPLLTLNNTQNINTWADGDVVGELKFTTDDANMTNPIASIRAVHNRAGTGHSANDAGLEFYTSATTTGTIAKRMEIESATGNVSLFEDTGTTAKLFWDASAESLGIGTTSPVAKLHIENGDIRIEKDTKATIGFRGHTTGSTALAFRDSNAAVDRMTIDSSGRLLVGLTGASGFGTVETDTLTTTGQCILARTGGNVGIGTSSPEEALHVSGSFGDAITSKFENTGSALSYIEFENSAASGALIGARGQRLSFLPNGTETMVIDSSGNVGIGTASPATQLHVYGASPVGLIQATSGNSILQIQSASGSDSSIVRFGDNIDGDVGNITYTHSNNAMAFTTGASERMRIDSSGNLLVGTTDTNPTTGTSEGIVLGAGGIMFASNTSDAAIALNRTSTDGDIAIFKKNGTPVGSIGTVVAGAANQLYINSDDVGLRFRGSDDSIVPCTSAGSFRDAAVDLGKNTGRFKDLHLSGTIGLTTADNASAANIFVSPSTDFVYFEHPSNGMIFRNTSGSEAMRLDSSGRLIIGYTAADGIGGAPSDNNLTEIGKGYINLNRDDTASAVQIQFGKNGAVAGSIVTTSSTTYNTTSDRRAKESIADADDAGAIVDAIRVRKFDWKADGSHQRYGMIAQELLESAPEVVHQPENLDDMMGVDYSKLVPMMLKEIQSLRARVAQLEGEA